MRAAGLSICGTLAVLAGCVLPTPAPAAGAPEPGVHVEQGSPAEKQYVLTLNQARQTGGGSGSSSGSSPQPFGSGITPPKGGGGGGTHGGGATGASGASGSAPTGQGAPTTHASSSTSHPRGRSSAGQSGSPTAAPVALPPAVLHATRSQGSGSSDSLLVLLGGGLAVLVLGGFGGTVLRHSRRPTPSG